MSAKIKRQLLPYAVVVMLAYIGFALPLPILPEMFLDAKRSISPSGMSLALRTILLGVMLTAFPLGQFFGSPVLGALSDRFGRKRIILSSLMGTTVGFCVTAWSVGMRSLEGIFLGLFICGLCEGNISIAQSAVADLTTKENRSQYFGWLQFFINAGFILGPLIGGKLSDPAWFGGLTFATPFWFGAVLTVCGIGVIAVRAQETRVRKEMEKRAFFGSLRELLRFPKIRAYYAATFFAAMGFFYFFRFVAVYAERVFDLTTSGLGYLLTYNSVVIALALLFLVPRVEKRLEPAKILAVFSLLLGVSFLIFVVPNGVMSFVWTIPIVGCALAMVLTFGSVLISTTVSDHFQGRAMGFLVSLQVVAEMLTSASGGFLAAVFPSLPLIVGAGMAWIAALILLRRR